MLLSFSPPFVFIHIDKAAGSSIQLALQAHSQSTRNSRLRRRMTLLGRLNRSAGLYRALEFPEHVTARTVQRCLPPALYDNAFKFAFVRNPWDRLVSRYAFLLKTEFHPEHRRIMRMTRFEEYIEWEIRRGGMLQSDYVTSANGKSLVDFVGYYERLDRDFAYVCSRLKLEANLPHDNASKHSDYRSYYTDSGRELVARHFERDIELFDYDFDGPRGAVSAEVVART